MPNRGRKFADLLCYLCGVNPGETRDHIFPKNLFRRPLPSNLLTAPACNSCNNSLSNDGELFRVFVPSGDAYETEAGRGIWDERVRPSLRMDRRGIRTHLREVLKELPIFSPTGDLIGMSAYLEADREAIYRVLAKIGKGLYYQESGQPLPNQCVVLSAFDEGDPGRFLEPPLDEAIVGAKRTDVGDGVVTYWRKSVAEDPVLSITWVAFYGDKSALITTQREDSSQS